MLTLIKCISSQSSDGLISEHWSIRRELMVEGIPLEVVVVLHVDVTMDNGLSNVEEEKHWNRWVHESCPVSRKANVQLSISLKSCELVPVSVA